MNGNEAFRFAYTMLIGLVFVNAIPLLLLLMEKANFPISNEMTITMAISNILLAMGAMGGIIRAQLAS